MDNNISTRVNLLKAVMGFTTGQLAAELGISRATLNNAIKVVDPRQLSKIAAHRLGELEIKHGLDKIDKPDNILTARDQPGKYIAECQSCRDKDIEILYLRDALAKSNDNLSAIIDLMQAKNGCAIPASGACYKPGKQNSKKGA